MVELVARFGDWGRREAKVLVEEREYVLHSHVTMAEYFDAYGVGLLVQKRMLGGFLGSFVTEFGVQNQLVQLWAYSDLEDRRARRARLAQEEAWQQCLAVIRPMIRSMENRIMYPTAVSPIRTLPVVPQDSDTAFAS